MCPLAQPHTARSPRRVAQVRFGVLNAGFYGLGQSRKRAFLLAAAPGETMPDWPAPLTCFGSPQLAVPLPDGSSFCAVPQRGGAAPLRSVTVRDVIGDLPPVPNGASEAELPYGGPPQSAFQADIRSASGLVGLAGPSGLRPPSQQLAAAAAVKQHVCKVLSDLNLHRCSLIPKESHHDWRYLRKLCQDDPSMDMFQGGAMTAAQPLVPLCLPNTELKHNGWRGLYSRLDLGGHFPTSVTDPNPMGKVGQVFHPQQDRIVSVRECARSQGFPDTFQFYGQARKVRCVLPPQPSMREAPPQES